MIFRLPWRLKRKLRYFWFRLLCVVSSFNIILVKNGSGFISVLLIFVEKVSSGISNLLSVAILNGLLLGFFSVMVFLWFDCLGEILVTRYCDKNNSDYH